MDCLDEQTVVELLEGRLAADRWAAVDQHIDGCAMCRRLLSTLVEAPAARSTVTCDVPCQAQKP